MWGVGTWGGTNVKPGVAVSAIAALVALLVVWAPSTEAKALSGSDFQAGNIISDEVFFNSSTMNEAQVQAFLNSKVANCVGANGYPCLKDFRMTTFTRAAIEPGHCTAYQGAADEPAARIIVKTAQACRINPQVLLVMLQKEQSLITTTSPTSRQYQAAMGYGCPDTAPCSTEFYGFYNQVYKAAWQLRQYTNYPARTYRIGNVSIGYHPSASCGSSVVAIKNQATANLYNYTPYQPNAAALANLRGTGDGCSAYGNRNFWVFFNDWFGSPTGPTAIGTVDSAALVRTAGAADIVVSGWTFDRAGPSASIDVRFTVERPTRHDDADGARRRLAARHRRGLPGRRGPPWLLREAPGHRIGRPSGLRPLDDLDGTALARLLRLRREAGAGPGQPRLGVDHPRPDRRRGLGRRVGIRRRRAVGDLRGACLRQRPRRLERNGDRRERGTHRRGRRLPGCRVPSRVLRRDPRAGRRRLRGVRVRDRARPVRVLERLPRMPHGHGLRRRHDAAGEPRGVGHRHGELAEHGHRPDRGQGHRRGRVGYPTDSSKEWATVGGRTGSTLTLTWATPQTVSAVVLFDRPNLGDRVTGGTLTFSDGTVVNVPALDDAGGATTVSFPARSATSIRFTVTSVSGSTVNVGLAEMQAFGQPAAGPTTNVAGSASASASSQNTSTGQTAAKAVDGVAAGYPGDSSREWATVGGRAGSWLTLTWSSARTVSSVVLHDRPNTGDRVTGGTLTFSDGSVVTVPALDDAGGATTVTFPARSTTSIRFTVSSVSASTANVGLAEILVMATGALRPLRPRRARRRRRARLRRRTPDADPDADPDPDPDADARPRRVNLARTATVVASSQNTSTGQTAAKAIDGVAAGYPGDSSREWATVGGRTGAALYLSWTTPQTVGSVVLFDRPNLGDRVTGGTLTFSDGTVVNVPALDDAGGATKVSFPARSTTGIRFTVTSVSGTYRERRPR